MTQLEIEIREAAGQVVDVSFPKRQIELVVMPYEAETQVQHKGRWIREIVARGAFEGLDKRRRITVNRGHVIDRAVGKAIALHPSREEGLVAEIQISDTELGKDTLQLAADGVLDASAGFGVMDGGESWPERNLRRLTRLWLHHIAMVPDPAYTDAKVLAVREADRAVAPAAARPNLEIYYGWKLADRYAKLDLTT